MDLMHRLQSIHITLLSKNITPDKTEQLTSSSPSQCRVLPAQQEPPSGSCQQKDWCSQPGPLTPVHPQSPWPLLCRMGLGRWALMNPATTLGGVFLQPSAPVHCHKLLPRSRADHELQPCQHKTWHPDPSCKGAGVCQGRSILYPVLAACQANMSHISNIPTDIKWQPDPARDWDFCFSSELSRAEQLPKMKVPVLPLALNPKKIWTT